MISKMTLASAISLTVLFIHVEADKVTRSISGREGRELSEELFVDGGGGYEYTSESSKSSSKGGKGDQCESSKSKSKRSGYSASPGPGSTICQVFEFLKESHSQQSMCQNFDVKGYCDLIDHLDPHFNGMVCPCHYEKIKGYDNKIEFVCPHDGYKEMVSENRYGKFCSKALGFHNREWEAYSDLLVLLGTDRPITPPPKDDDDCFFGCEKYVKYCCCENFDPEPTPKCDGDICVPPSGGCINSFEGLLNATTNAQSNDVIAVCGGSMLESSQQLTIPSNAENVTVCCFGEEECRITATGDPHRILQGEGDSLTLCGIDMEGGDATGTISRSGGNVDIMGGGNHRIINSRLSGGTALLGGNLYVGRPRGSADSLLLSGSVLEGGNSGCDGGGALVSVATANFVDSLFTNNRAGTGLPDDCQGFSYDGGGFVVFAFNVTVNSCTFEENEALNGGGFWYGGFVGVNNFFSIMSSTFNVNSATNIGGGGVITKNPGDDDDIAIIGNNGAGNIASNCTDFFIVDGPCVPLNGIFPSP